MAKSKRSRHDKTPTLREKELWWNSAQIQLCEFSRTHILQKSYVISAFWAWYSHVKVSPKVNIPVPGFFTFRDP